MTDPLDRAAAALRAAPVPPGPPPDLEAATVAALAAADRSSLLWRRRMRLVRALGATAALAAAVAVAVTLGTGPRASALDAALGKVRAAKSVKFVNTLVVKHPDFGPQVETVYYQGAKARFEADGRVRVADYAANRGAFVYPGEKYVWRVKSLQKMDPPLAHFNKFVASRGKMHGTDKIGGAEATRYHIAVPDKDDPRDYRLWVDPRTGWPVKAEGKGTVDVTALDPKAPRPEYTITSDRFEWDVPLDETLFSLDVPPGYEAGDVPPELRPRKK